jgi:hypothetical protein
MSREENQQGTLACRPPEEISSGLWTKTETYLRTLSANSSNTTVSLGTVGSSALELPRDILERNHAVILGPTRSGKTYLLYAMLLQVGGCVVFDQKRETALGLFERCVEYDIGAFYWSPMMQKTLCLDPFCGHWRGVEHFSAKMETLKTALIRKHGLKDVYEQPRRSIGLDLVFAFCGTPVNGEYIGLDKCDQALDVGSAWWRQKFNSLKGVMDEPLWKEWERRSKTSPVQREKDFESTRTILADFLRPRVRAMLAPGKPFPFAFAVGHRWKCLFDLKPSDDFSQSDADTVTALLLSGFTGAPKPEHPFIIALEEVEKLLGVDIPDFLARMAADNKVIWMLAQDIECFRNRFVDVRTRAMSQCGVIITFGTKCPETLDYAKRVHSTRTLDITLKHTPHQLHDGYYTVEEPEVGVSYSVSQGRRTTTGTTRTHGTKTEDMQQASRSEEESVGYEVGTSAQRTDRSGTSTSRSTGHQESQTTGINNSYRTGRQDAEDSATGDTRSTMIDESSLSQNRNNGSTWTSGEESSTTTGRDMSRGRSTTGRIGQAIRRMFSSGTKDGTMRSSAWSQSESRDEGETRGVTRTFRKHILSRYKTIWLPSGWMIPRDMQEALIERLHREFQQGQMMISVGNLPSVAVNVHRLPQPFEGRETCKKILMQRTIKTILDRSPWLIQRNGTMRCDALPQSPPACSTSSPPDCSALTRLLKDVQRNLQRTESSIESAT